MNIVVAGAGVVGLACAWRLSQAGARVVVLDSRRCGQGATLAALGALWPAGALARGPLQLLHRASLWQFESFARELSEFTGMPVSFRRHGRIEFLTSDKAAPRAREEASAARAEWPSFSPTDPVMELLDPAQVAAQWPQFKSPGFGALRCRATAQVCVEQLVAALRQACLRAGVAIREECPVTAVDSAGGRVTGVRCAAETIAADAVLLAAGAWTSLLGEHASVAQVRPAKGQGLALQMPPGVRLETIVKCDKTYLIPWPERGEILVGSTTEPEAGFDETPTPEGREKLLSGAVGIMPALCGAVVLRHWAGLRPQNPAKRHPPIMGPHPELRNLFFSTAHFKTGIGLAPRVAAGMTRWMLKGEMPAELAAFCPRT